MNKYKVTKEFLESQIENVSYKEIVHQKIIHCTITVKNGYTFTGEARVINPDNFDRIIGDEIAYENAFDKMWSVYGYLVQEQMYRERILSPLDRMEIEFKDLSEKIEKAEKYCLHHPENVLLCKQLEIMKAYKAVLEERIKTF